MTSQHGERYLTNLTNSLETVSDENSERDCTQHNASFMAMPDIGYIQIDAGNDTYVEAFGSGRCITVMLRRSHRTS